jgi:predicted permease
VAQPLAVLGALAPVFLMILMGFGARRLGLVPDAFWGPAERVTYYLFFPALVVDNLARADLAGAPVLPMAAALVGGVLAAAAPLVLLRRRIPVDGPGFTSLVQGAIRPNVYVGVAAAAALFGPPALGLFAVGLATALPLVNVLGVAALQRWGSGAAGRGPRAALVGLARNPIIVAVAIGGAMNLLGLGRLPVVSPTVQALAAASLPLGLLAVGAGLDLKAMRGAGRGVALSAGLKLLAAPAATGALGASLGVEGTALAVLVLFNGAPCAAASYVIARQMGGDHRLMAAIVTGETLLAALTMPLLLAALA